MRQRTTMNGTAVDVLYLRRFDHNLYQLLQFHAGTSTYEIVKGRIFGVGFCNAMQNAYKEFPDSLIIPVPDEKQPPRFVT